MYYVFAEVVFPHRWIGDEPYLENISFWNGRPIKKTVPGPLVFTMKTFDPRSDAHVLAHYYDCSIPLFSDALIAGLHQAGITNFDCYEAEIHDPDDGEICHTHKAVNVLGLVAAADMNKSKHRIHDGIPLVDVEFDDLVIDPEKAADLDMFRLAESSANLVFHERLVRFLDENGFKDQLKFWDPRRIAL